MVPALAPRAERLFPPSSGFARSAACPDDGRTFPILLWLGCQDRFIPTICTARGPNPRFVVTSLPRELEDAEAVYRAIYCARGDAENRIKEQQLDLFATRTSGHRMRVNQIRLWFSTIAYTVIDALRRLGLAGSTMAHSYCGTIRTRLLKIGARVRVSVRRVWISLASAHPAEAVFAHAYDRLMRAGP